MKFKITYIETLEKNIILECDDKIDAYKKAKNIYKNESIILYPEDYVDTKIVIEEIDHVF